MAPLPNNNTATYYVDYRANGNDHTVQFRYGVSGTAAEPDSTFIARVGSLFNDLVPFFPSDLAILGARFRADGGSVTLPATAPAFTATPTGAPELGDSPGFLAFIGRSAGGRRARVYFLGLKAGAAQSAGEWSNYRVNRGENATITAAIDNIQGADFLGIDGLAVTWYDYVNAGYNSYWQRKARG